MKNLAIILLLSAPTWAAVTGTVVNGTTGQPQGGATVGFDRLTQNGPERVDQAKSDSQGKFTINQQPQGPSLLHTEIGGVVYNLMIPPGVPAAGLTLDVYNSSTKPGAAKVTKHMILLQPTGGQVTVNETYLYENTGKVSWNDPGHGTLHFFVPAGAGGKVEVNGTPPGGLPIAATVSKSSEANVYKVDFPVRPGETRFDLAYTVPYKEGADYAGKVITKDENTYLIVPNGVTIAGANLEDMGTEPRTQAHIYGLSAAAYKVKLTGQVAAAPDAAADSGAGQSDDGPQIEQIMPRLYGKAGVIVAVSLGILALGFALLYRKESHERGRG